MAETVFRTARIVLRPTRGQRRRLFGLLRSGGDVWAWILDCNRQLRAWGLRPVVGYQALCRELAGVRFGELDMVGARSVLRRYSQAWFEASARRGRGEAAGFPRRKRGLFALRYYNGTFSIRGDRLRLPTARGGAPLVVRLARALPYPVAAIRSVTLLCDAGRLVVDVGAELPVAIQAPGDGIGGVDLGIIHPYAVAAADQALLVSGRALRAEERLHLADTKARARLMARKTPRRRGHAGSRRWRKMRRRQRQAGARHRRRIRGAHHQAARQVVAWAVEQGVGTLVVGDLRGILRLDAGRRHNRRMRSWRPAHLLAALRDKAQLAGISLVLVDERGTSSTCPDCARRIKANGRNLRCHQCGYRGHRDIAGARMIAAKGGGDTRTPVRITHRRAGHVPARRDHRRHQHDRHRAVRRRSCPAPGRPESLGESLAARQPGNQATRQDCLTPITGTTRINESHPAELRVEPS